MSTYEARILAENETLREENRRLRGLLVPVIAIPPAAGLCGQEANVFAALTSREWVTTESLCTAAGLSSWNPGGEIDPKHLKVLVMRVRRKMKAYGVQIETVWGQGYRLLDRQRWARARA